MNNGVNPTYRGKPLRVLMISEFPREGIIVGGVQSAVQILAHSLARDRAIEALRLVDFRYDISEPEVRAINEKFTVHHMPSQRRLALPTRAFMNLRKAREIMRDFKPDVVHGQGLIDNGDIAIRSGYPSVVTIHGVGTYEVEIIRQNPILRVLRVQLSDIIVKRVLRRASVVISISDFDERFYGSVLNADRVVRIPNAVREEFFDPCSPNAENRVLYAGILDSRKNVTGIVRAFARVRKQVPDAQLDLAGPKKDPRYYEKILQTIHDEQAEGINLCGNLTARELGEMMRRSKIVVLFSHHENAPVVVAEAQALGKPVVSSRVGAIAEMVEDGRSGFLVQPGDEAGFVERLTELLRNTELQQSMGQRGQEIAREKWEPQKVASETIRAYHLAIRRFH